MRIIAGEHKSRKLVTLPGNQTRPMTDRMKESIFNIIGPYFTNETVLDLFGGSGALSLEALSRGATKAVISEKDREALKVIKKNISNLRLEDKVELFFDDYKNLLKRLAKEEKSFDIIFVDPPYALLIINDVVSYLLDNNIALKGSYIICHYLKGKQELLKNKNLKIVKHDAHGISEFCVYLVV